MSAHACGLTKNGFWFALWRDRLSSEQFCDPSVDWLVWFVKDLGTNEIVGHFILKASALHFINRQGVE